MSNTIRFLIVVAIQIMTVSLAVAADEDHIIAAARSAAMPVQKVVESKPPYYLRPLAHVLPDAAQRLVHLYRVYINPDAPFTLRDDESLRNMIEVTAARRQRYIQAIAPIDVDDPDPPTYGPQDIFGREVIVSLPRLDVSTRRFQVAKAAYALGISRSTNAVQWANVTETYGGSVSPPGTRDLSLVKGQLRHVGNDSHRLNDKFDPLIADMDDALQFRIAEMGLRGQQVFGAHAYVDSVQLAAAQLKTMAEETHSNIRQHGFEKVEKILSSSGYDRYIYQILSSNIVADPTGQSPILSAAWSPALNDTVANPNQPRAGLSMMFWMGAKSGPVLLSTEATLSYALGQAAAQ